MQEENNNTDKPEVKVEETQPAPPAPAEIPAQPFPEPKILEAVVDPNQKQKEQPSVFSFTSPQVIQKNQTLPTKGDVAKSQGTGTDKTKSDTDALKALDEEIRKEDELEAAAGNSGLSDYRDTAEMVVEGWEGLVQLFGMAYSKDFSSASTYAFLEEKKKKLIHLGTKISRRRNWVLKPEYLFINNLITETTRSVMKAHGSRKTFMAQRRKEEEQNKPPETVKGGPNKGEIKTRGPGRPKK